MSAHPIITHQTDGDCRPYVNAVSGECRVCRALVGEPCPECGRRIEHLMECGTARCSGCGGSRSVRLGRKGEAGACGNEFHGRGGYWAGRVSQ